MRVKLVMALADGWRVAENMYLETGDPTGKYAMKQQQDNSKLTEKETKAVEEICDSMGV